MPRSFLRFITCASVVLGVLGAPLKDTSAGPFVVEAQDFEPRTDIAMLEDAFWRCDYVATTRGIHETPAEACGAAYAALRDGKFAGSFDAMLTWWKANKPHEHRRIADSEL